MMLNYPMRSDGMYILRSDDFDDIASRFLGEYAPQNLHTPQPLDIDYIINDCLFLDIKQAHIELNGNILGLIAFEDVDVLCSDLMYREQTLSLSAGSILLEYDLFSSKEAPRLKFTKTHEVAHWICHRSYHSLDNRPFECRTAPYIACRRDNIEMADPFSKSVSNWEEWQANRLAGSLLMPKANFVDVAKCAMSNHDIRNTESRSDTRKIYAVIEDISKVFCVSKTAVKVRLMQVGMLTGYDPYNLTIRY